MNTNISSIQHSEAINSKPIDEPSCESTQLSVSEKLDLSLPLSASETQHIASCSDCKQFVNFVQNSEFTNLAAAPMSEENDLTESIMQRLQGSDKIITPAPYQWRRILSIGSVAAAAAVIISTTLNHDSPVDTKISSYKPQPTDDTESTLNRPAKEIVAVALDEEIIKENLQNQYQAISSVAGEKWTNVSTNLIQATEFVSEKTEQLSQIILFRNEEAPHSMNDDIDSLEV